MGMIVQLPGSEVWHTAQRNGFACEPERTLVPPFRIKPVTEAGQRDKLCSRAACARSRNVRSEP